MERDTKQPKVTLVSWTPKPLETLCWTCLIYTQVGLDSIDKIKDHGMNSEEDMKKFLAPFLQEPHKTFLEYIQMIFIIENVSRSFQQQLTRHRQASYAIQSLRVYDVGAFADNGNYTIPSTVKNKTMFHGAMLMIQHAYNEAVESGENLEDARGLLPLNVHSTITMRVDMNALMHILQGRLCLTAQSEARQVGYLMKKEVDSKMGPFFGNLLQPPCHLNYGGKCTREHYYCGIPLYLASTNPKEFKEWYDKTGGKPEGSKVPTNSVLLQEDVEEIEKLQRLAL